MRGVIIFLIITVIHLSCELNSDTRQSKYPRYEFILHKCIASAQLHRRYQNVQKSNVNSNKNENFLHKAYALYAMQQNNSTSLPLEPEVSSTSISINTELNNSEIYKS
ncbi:uncharacterized protein LOC113463871 [Ceratina calcarata]|uniref:Uncharacterized protein LOC113463871 n=1 Tax=Ceratina calcarata TaxID=156304 RepID=A0AAJ7RWQ6_9HYME|nr:uncharacterized protein LOC113463871 [Ceratina calcarata]